MEGAGGGGCGEPPASSATRTHSAHVLPGWYLSYITGHIGFSEQNPNSVQKCVQSLLWAHRFSLKQNSVLYFLDSKPSGPSAWAIIIPPHLFAPPPTPLCSVSP